MTKPLEKLSDFVELAHARIQKDFADINPVIGINQKLRSVGFPADAMTIDCLKSKKRIIVILHDDMPEIVRYQFSFLDKDPGDTFEELSIQDLSENHLYDWMKSYFS